jgi:plastocyanin
MRKLWSIVTQAGLFLLVTLHVSTPTQAHVFDVTLSDTAITPATVIIAPGDTVRWTVATGIHQLHSDTDSFLSWDSGLLDTPGQTYQLTLTLEDGPGPFGYLCLVHGHFALMLTPDTCFATGTLNDSGLPTVADLVTLLRVFSGDAPVPENLYRLDLTGDCIVDEADAEALSVWFQQGPGSLPQYPVPTCCYPELLPPACLILMTGDANLSGTVTSGDIIYILYWLFGFGPPPEPCFATADVNCDGIVTSADMITMVNYVFKGGPAFCDVCALIPDTWSCP